MNLKLLILGVLLFLNNLVKAQNFPIDTVVVDIQKVIFIANDTAYQLTKYVNEFGYFSFTRGFQDYTSEDSLMSFSLVKKELIVTKKVYNILDKVDTIKSYRTDYIKYMNQKDTVIKQVTYLIDNLIDDVMISSIFQCIDVSNAKANNQPILRMLYNVEENSILYKQLVENNKLIRSTKGPFHHGSLCYLLMEIEFFNNKTVFKRATCVSVDKKGIYKIETDTALIKLNDVKKLNEQLNKAKFQSDLHCEFPGDISLLEFWSLPVYKNFVFSEDCLLYNRELKAERRVFELILNLYFKYF